MIAVIGANGFIGRHFVNYGIKSGMDVPVRLFARDFSGFPFDLPSGMVCKEADFLDPATYIDHIKDCRVLLLLVSVSGVRTFSDDVEKEYHLNVHPYQKLLEGIAKRKTDIEHIVFLSSGGAIYGAVNNPVPIDEDHPADPVSAYGNGKLQIENHIINFARDIPFDYTILRAANPVGLWNKKANLVSAALESLRTGKPLNVLGDGSVVRDYFDVRELAQAIWMSIQNPAARNKIYNLGSGKARTINDVLRVVSEVTGQKLAINRQEGCAADVPYNVLNCAKIQSDLGWKAQHSLHQIVEEMCRQRADVIQHQARYPAQERCA